MAPPDVYIAVIGAGGVGQAFLSQLEALRRKWGETLHVVLIARSKTCIQASSFEQPLSLASWQSDLQGSQTPTPSPAQLLAFLKSAPSGSAQVLVDNTASNDWGAAYPQFLQSGVHVVTPNKKAFSSDAELWTAIQDASSSHGGGRIFHEATVGAGLPVLSTLDDLLATGDVVTRIEGVFSGTLSFLFNQFAPVGGAGASSSSSSKEALPSWSAAVTNAKALGYTEPDPRDDLSGMDVARKLTILARRCGVPVAGPEGFAVQSLVPGGLQEVQSSDEFLARLPQFDADMETLRLEAERKGAVLRYVGSLDVAARRLSVGLKHVPQDSPIAALQGSDNLIAFHTRRYNNTPLVVQGAGAGADVTAMGVTADLIRVLQRL